MVGDSEVFECLPLHWGGRGDLDEGWQVVGGLNLVGADGGQIGEQAGEAVHRVFSVVGLRAALASAASERSAAATGLARLAVAAGLSLSWKRIGARACFMCQLM